LLLLAGEAAKEAAEVNGSDCGPIAVTSSASAASKTDASRHLPSSKSHPVMGGELLATAT